MNRPLSSYIHEIESVLGSSDTAWLDACNTHKVKSIFQIIKRKFCQGEEQIVAPMTTLVEDIKKKLYDNADIADNYSSSALVISTDELEALLEDAVATNVATYLKALKAHQESIASANASLVHELHETQDKIIHELDFYMERYPNTRTQVKVLLRREIVDKVEAFLKVGEEDA